MHPQPVPAPADPATLDAAVSPAHATARRSAAHRLSSPAPHEVGGKMTSQAPHQDHTIKPEPHDEDESSRSHAFPQPDEDTNAQACVRAERLILEQFERLRAHKAQVDSAFKVSGQKLQHCAGLLHQYHQHQLLTRADGSAISASPAVLGDADAVARRATGEAEMAKRCVASTEEAIINTGQLFRFLFERLYLHQLVANTDFVEGFERVLGVTSATPSSHGAGIDEEKEANRGGTSSSSSVLCAQPVREALERLKLVPSAVQRFQAECQRVQAATPSVEPLSSAALTATTIFAVSADYSAEEQLDIIKFLNDTLHVTAVVLPSGVPEVDLALVLRCRFLVSPKTAMKSPILAMPRERVVLAYRRLQNDKARSSSTTSATADAAPSSTSLDAETHSHRLESPGDGDRARVSLSADATDTAIANENEEGTAPAVKAEYDADEAELAAVADADAELLALLQLLDMQQHRQVAPERAPSPFPYLPSPNSERSRTFPPNTVTPHPEEATPQDPAPPHLTTLVREDSLSNSTAFSQISTTQTGSAATQEPLLRARTASSTQQFTRHRQHNPGGLGNDGLGRMSVATQPSIFFAHSHKRPRHELASASDLSDGSAAPYSPTTTVTAGTTRPKPVSPFSPRQTAKGPTDALTSADEEAEEPVVVVATQNTVVESQHVRYDHAARHMTFKPLDETLDAWVTTAATTNEDSNTNIHIQNNGNEAETVKSDSASRTSGGGDGDGGAEGNAASPPRSDSDSRSCPYVRALRTSVDDEEDGSVGFASVHSPLDGVAPLMLPGTAAAMRSPASAWLFQISNSVRDQRAQLVERIRQLGGEVDLGSAFNPKTTHLITAEGLTERTEKYLSACAAGILIVPPRCVLDSARRGHWVRGHKMLEYNMNPCRRFLSYGSECHGLPFAHWRVLLVAGHASVAKGIRTVLEAGGCAHVSVLVFDLESQAPSPQEPSVAAAVAALTNTPVTSPTAVDAQTETRDGQSSTVGPAAVPPLPPLERTGLHPLSAIEPGLIGHSTHILVECAEMSTRTPGTFQLPAWFPVCLMRRELYPRIFTLEILYHTLCSSLEQVFQPVTGELLSETALIPACRVEPFK